MGSGLAKQIKDRFPNNFKIYKKLCLKEKALLGKCLVVKENDKIIANLFGQDKFGRDKKYTNYDAFKLGIKRLFLKAESENYSIAIPYKIGCGLGGGDWRVIYNIIEQESVFKNIQITIYKFKG